MKPSYARHRADSTTSALVQELRAHGLGYVPLGASIDGVVWLGPHAALVDFKTGKGPRTRTQQALVDQGAPIYFLANTADVNALVADLRGRVRKDDAR